MIAGRWTNDGDGNILVDGGQVNFGIRLALYDITISINASTGEPDSADLSHQVRTNTLAHRSISGVRRSSAA